jgi:hypothetical protein
VFFEKLDDFKAFVEFLFNQDPKIRGKKQAIKTPEKVV